MDDDPTHPQTPPSTGRLERTVDLLSHIVAPTTLVTALMVYFGWTVTRTVYGSFGVDWTVLGFSLQDYVFRSVGATFTPAAGLLLVFLVLVPAHGALTLALNWHVRRGGHRAVAPVVIGLIGLIGLVLAALGVLGFTDFVQFRTRLPVVPSLLGFGAVLLWYATSLYRRTTHHDLRLVERRTPLHTAWTIVFGTFLVLTLFWSVAVYGQVAGITQAENIAQEPRALPGVIIYTPDSLRLDVVDVRETRLVGENLRYRFRYDGLRLLVKGPNRWVLLPETYRAGTRAIVLPDDPTIRMEFFLGARARP